MPAKRAFAALSAIGVAVLLLSLSAAHAQTPEPTATAPAVSLAAPTGLHVQADRVDWVDMATGEDGYRVVATLGSESRTFDLPVDSTSLTLPEDFRASCNTPGRTILTARVFAFTGTEEGEAATASSTMLCPPAVTPSPSAPAVLPGTGYRAEGESGEPTAWPMLLLVAVMAVAAASLVVMRAPR